MFNWLRRKRLSAEARRKLLVIAARSEEAITETHVENVLDLLRTLQGEVELERGVDLYAEMMGLPEQAAAAVHSRLLMRAAGGGGGRGSGGAGGRGRRFENVFGDDFK